MNNWDVSEYIVIFIFSCLFVIFLIGLYISTIKYVNKQFNNNKKNNNISKQKFLNIDNELFEMLIKIDKYKKLIDHFNIEIKKQENNEENKRLCEDYIVSLENEIYILEDEMLMVLDSANDEDNMDK